MIWYGWVVAGYSCGISLIIIYYTTFGLLYNIYSIKYWYFNWFLLTLSKLLHKILKILGILIKSNTQINQHLNQYNKISPCTINFIRKLAWFWITLNVAILLGGFDFWCHARIEHLIHFRLCSINDSVHIVFPRAKLT